MKTPVPLTAKILMLASRNYVSNEAWVDWAIQMMEAGYESKNLYMLAGLTQPLTHNQFELKELTDRVLLDLKLDYSDTVIVLKNYVRYLVSSSIDRPTTFYQSLWEIAAISRELNYDPEYADFYLLYYAKSDLIESNGEWQHYWPDANQENIDQIINEQFKLWMNKTESEKE